MSCQECGADEGHFATCSKNIGKMLNPRTCPETKQPCHSRMCSLTCRLKGEHHGIRSDSDSPVHTGASVEPQVSSVSGCEFCHVKQGYPHFPSCKRSPEFVELKENILQEAMRIIYGDREKTYGSPEKNLLTIAGLWATYLKGKYPDKPLDAMFYMTIDDVCLMMVLLKVARLANDPTHRDSQADGCGYFALMERVQEHMKNK